jgi:hypothetical protein
MAFKQYTKCVEFDDFKSHWQGSSQGAAAPLFFNALSQAFVYMILGALAGAGLGSLIPGIGTLVGAAWGAYTGFSYGFVSGFCDQWLNWRLICVKRDQCAGGRVSFIETVEAKFGHDPIEWLFDNDLSFNLRLSPYNGKKVVNGHFQPQFPRDGSEEYGIASISNDPFPSADVLRKPREADGTEWDLSYEGYEGGEKKNHPGGRWSLHCEIEGNGMDLLCTIAKVLAFLGPLGGALGVIGGAILGAIYLGSKAYQAVHKGCKKVCKIPILCDVVCFLAAAAAAIVAGFIGLWLGAVGGAIPGLGAVVFGGLLGAIFRHNGSFDDVKNDPDSGTIEEEDCVFVFGDEVYDGGHEEGWVEIHPVKHLQKVCSRAEFLEDKDFTGAECCPGAPTDSTRFKDLNFIAEVKQFWARWCGELTKANDPATQVAQQDPRNIWCLHPLIDGCEPGGGGVG